MRPSRAWLAAAAGALLAWSLAAGTAAATVQQAPASRIAVDLPAGYVPSRHFSGFINAASGVSLIVVELPAAAYEQLASGLTPEALAMKGVTRAEAGKLKRTAPYLYMRGEQQSAQGPVAKFLMAFSDGTVTALVTANVPRAALAGGLVRAEEIEGMLASVSVAPEPAPPKEVFRLGHLGPFKPAGSILGTTRAYTLDGRLEPSRKGEARPILVVAPSLDERPVADAQGYAETLLGGLPGLTGTRTGERRQTAVGGLPAVEIVGSATDADSGREVVVYQMLVVPPGGGYLRLLAQLPPAERERLLPEVRRIAESLRPAD